MKRRFAAEARPLASDSRTEDSSLQRFVEAQAPVFNDVVAELRAGRKQTHWMWFVFPQLAALGRSPTAKFYGIEGIEEAAAYLAHPVLGARLMQCIDLVLAIEGKTAQAIFGSPDDLKFRSCLTLFEVVSPSEKDRFAHALGRFYGGQRDEKTVSLLS